MSQRVLLMDSDPLLLSIYHAYLTAQQIEVHTACSAEECREELRRWGPDVLVLDADQIGKSELAVLTLTRKGSTSPAVPVLLLTSIKALGNVAFSHGRFTILVKPVPMMLLRDGICALANAKETSPPRQGTVFTRQPAGEPL
jgi:DNA-binding response OmpR family regulator